MSFFFSLSAMAGAWLFNPCVLHAQHQVNFDAGWSYVRDGLEHMVTLPRAWNEDAAFRVHIENLPTDTVRYVKTFEMDRKMRGKRVFIEFEGARQKAEVWLNGHRLGLNDNGVGPFGFDLTPYLRQYGKNRLEVLTDNAWNYREDSTGTGFQWNNKNFNANYGGLPKHVYLHAVGEVYQTLPLWSSFHTQGVYVYASDMDVNGRRAVVHVESEVVQGSTRPLDLQLDVAMTAPDGHLVGRWKSPVQTVAAGDTVCLKAQTAVEGLHFWSWGYGYLYKIRTRVTDGKGHVLDEQTTTTGFRKTDYTDGLFRLNDRVMMVHGYAQRTSNEWPGVGMSVPAWLSDYSNGLMVGSGGNLVRWMHVAPWRQDVESCDRVGLLQAMPAGDAEKDVAGRQWKQRVELMRDMIVYYRNNPSIFFYECGNKGISEAHMIEMKALRDAFDSHGGRAIGCREMLSSSTAEYGGEMLYINKSASKPVWAMEYCRDEGLRRYWNDWSYPYHKNGDGPLYRNADASAYNLNQDQLAIEHVRRWYDYWSVRPGTGRRVSSGGVKIVFSDTNTHCRGESDYRTSGVVDAMRLPKDSFFAHQVMWNGWVTPDSSLTYVMGHWNYNAGQVLPVYVVSDAPCVRLKLNGRTVGGSGRTESHFLHTFDSVRYEPGTLVAESLDGEGRVLSSYELHTAGEPARLHLTALTSPEGFKADGADMALLTFEVTDADGLRCPLDHRTVHFTVEGPAEWRGGIGPGEGNCVTSLHLPVECGVNRALIRSTGQKGEVKIVARAAGLPDAELRLVAGGEAVDNRQVKAFRTVSLRGETPSSASYRTVSESVPVTQVEAGCNQQTAWQSVDDNEETEWRNDGTARTAWIRYRFAAPQRVDALSVKLTGWRRRSYPLEVVDDSGRVVYSGSTPMSLGYVTLPLHCEAPTGSLTIRLKGQAQEREAFGQIVELAQPVANELDLYKAKDEDKVRQELRIIECDFLRYVTE